MVTEVLIGIYFDFSSFSSSGYYFHVSSDFAVERTFPSHVKMLKNPRWYLFTLFFRVIEKQLASQKVLCSLFFA